MITFTLHVSVFCIHCLIEKNLSYEAQGHLGRVDIIPFRVLISSLMVGGGHFVVVGLTFKSTLK